MQEQIQKSIYETLLETNINPPVNTVWSAKCGRLGVCLIEFRKHEWTKYVLWNMCNIHGGTDVCLYITHGVDNEDYIKQITNDWSNVIYIKLDHSNIDISMYNKILTSKSFYDNFQTEYILIFQTDTLIRKPIPDVFFEYQYVGAPWTGYPNDYPDNPHIVLGNKLVGNGGFSLRNVSRMKSIISTHPRTNHKLNEDVYITNHLRDSEIPSLELAKRFSVEWIYDDDPVGLHQVWRFHNIEKVKKLICKAYFPNM